VTDADQTGGELWLAVAVNLLPIAVLLLLAAVSIYVAVKALKRIFAWVTSDPARRAGGPIERSG
jgi:hypothetical protein